MRDHVAGPAGARSTETVDSIWEVTSQRIAYAHVFGLPAAIVFFFVVSGFDTVFLLLGAAYVVPVAALFLFCSVSWRTIGLAMVDVAVLGATTLFVPGLYAVTALASCASISVAWFFSFRVSLVLTWLSAGVILWSGLAVGHEYAVPVAACFAGVLTAMAWTNTTVFEDRRRASLELAELVNTLPVVIWERHTETGVYTEVSGRVDDLLGWDPDDVIGRSIDDMIHPDDLAAERDLASALPADGRAMQREIRMRHASGEWVRYRERVALVEGPLGSVVRGVSLDISDEDTARTVASQYTDLLDRMPDAFCIMSVDGSSVSGITQCNLAFADLFGLPVHQVIGDSVEPILAALGGEMNDEAVKVAADRLPLQGRDLPVRLGAGQRYIDYEFFPLTADSVSLRLTDVTERKVRGDLIKHQAKHDALTGLSNRSVLVERLDELFSRRIEGSPEFALLLLDLDHFKEVNDRLGHQVGDDLLRILSQRFSRSLRGDDIVARLGGDEFAFVVPQPGSRTAVEAFANRITQLIGQPISVRNFTLSVGASIGIAMSPDDGQSPDELMAHADIAMYEAKRSGEAYRWYTVDDAHHDLTQLEMMGQIRSLADGSQMQVMFQPKIDLQRGEVSGVEALMRWAHPDRGLLGPAEFLEALELSGLLEQATWQIFAKSLKAISPWPNLDVAVNIPASSVRSEAFPGRVHGLLHQFGVSADRLLIEITEREIMDDSSQVESVLNDVRELGVRVSIDDFGTGYSSLLSLRRLAVSELKIDREFVDGMLSSDNDYIIATSIIDLAHNLGLNVVAEGVENIETAQLLRELGCEQAQGFFFSRPIPTDDLADFIASPIPDLGDVSPSPEETRRG